MDEIDLKEIFPCVAVHQFADLGVIKSEFKYSPDQSYRCNMYYFNHKGQKYWWKMRRMISLLGSCIGLAATLSPQTPAQEGFMQRILRCYEETSLIYIVYLSYLRTLQRMIRQHT